MKGKRIVWLDLLKGFLIFLVVLGHALQYTGLAQTTFGEKIWFFIYSFHMIAFFMASGFLFYPKWIEAENKKEFLFWREISLIVPTAVFSAANVLLRYVTHQDASLWASVATTIKLFWFLGVLMLLEFFYPLLLTVFKNNRIGVAALLGTGWLLASPLSNEVGKFFGYFFVFVLAGWLKEIANTPRGGICIGAISLLVYGVLLVVFYRFWGTACIANSYAKLLLGLPGSCLIFWIFFRCFAKTDSSAFSRLGQYTMPVYLIHQSLFAFSGYLFALFPSIPSVVWMLILCVFGILFPIALAKGMDRVPLLRDVFHPTRWLLEKHFLESRA